MDTQAQADYLTAAGCHLLPGFHLAHPMPATQITELLTTAARTYQPGALTDPMAQAG